MDSHVSQHKDGLQDCVMASCPDVQSDGGWRRLVIVKFADDEVMVGGDFLTMLRVRRYVFGYVSPRFP